MCKNGRPFPLICKNGSFVCTGMFFEGGLLIPCCANFLFFLHMVHFLLILEVPWAINSSLDDHEFVHKTLCFSGYTNVRCVHWICNWWNRNFYSISVKNFQNMNFQNRSNDCAFRNSCPSLGFRTISRNRVFTSQKGTCSPSLDSTWSNFVLFPGCNKILELSFLALLCQLYLTGQFVEPLDSFWHPVSSCLCRKRYQELYFFWFQLGRKILLSTRLLARPFSSSVEPNW